MLELHGSVHRNACLGCGRKYPLSAVMESTGVPRCACGGVIKPDVVLYGEQLDEDVLKAAADALRRADLLLVAGTSLSVYPAAGLVRRCPGAVVVINRTPTPMDESAALAIAGSVGDVLAQIELG